jgi:hypothetical protein
MYLNLAGPQCTVAFGHGSKLVAARCIGMAPIESASEPTLAQQPSHDRHPPAATDSDVMTAINRRVDRGSKSMPAVPATASTNLAPAELCDELRMCMRHYQSLFHDVPVERIVFTGEGATAAGPCRDIARAIGLPAQIGDPLARWDATRTSISAVDWNLQLRPQWTIAAGLAANDQEANA